MRAISLQSFLIEVCFSVCLILKENKTYFFSIPDSVVLEGQVESAGGPEVEPPVDVHLICSFFDAQPS